MQAFMEALFFYVYFARSLNKLQNNSHSCVTLTLTDLNDSGVTTLTGSILGSILIEELCNQQHAEGYRLHTFAQSTAGSTGIGGGDRTVCNLVFERMN